jgi:hypothetical protein
MPRKREGPYLKPLEIEGREMLPHSSGREDGSAVTAPIDPPIESGPG